MVSWTEPPHAVFDAAPLSGDQRTGLACVACGKKWPLPRTQVGIVPDGTAVMACEDCADVVDESLHRDAVRRLVRDAQERADSCAPDIVAALIVSEPRYGDRHSRPLETAATAIARHIQETEDLGSQELLPAEITDWDDAYAWLMAWRQTQPPGAVLREVLHVVLVELEEGGSDG